MTAKDRPSTTLTAADTDVLLSGRYRIEAELGEGAAGHVLAARDVLLGRPVAVKVLDGLPDEVATGRALRAVRAASRCRHPQLVGVLDTERGRPAFVVLERVDARPLDADALDPHARVTVVDDVLAALAALHAGGAVHRDVQAGNVLLDAGGRAYLTAAGLTRAGGDPALGLRVDGDPSEQTADARADVAAAATLVRSLLSSQVGPHLDAVLRRAVSPDAGARPQEAGALRMLVTDALQADEQQRHVARSADAEPVERAAVVPPTPPRGSRVGQMALGVAAVLAAALLVVIPFVEGRGGEDSGGPSGGSGLLDEDLARILARADVSQADLGPQLRDLLRGIAGLNQLDAHERQARVVLLYGAASVMAASGGDDAALARQLSGLLQPELTLDGMIGLLELDPDAAGPGGPELSPRFRALAALEGDQRIAEAFALRLAIDQALADGQLTAGFHAAAASVLGPSGEGS